MRSSLPVSPGLRLPITRAFERASDPRTMVSLQQQFDTLTVSPLAEHLSTPALRNKRVVLILDALDECPLDLRTDILHAIRLTQTRLPSNVKCFVTSRPQSDIASAMETMRASGLSIAIATREAHDDVKSFITAELGRIREAKKLASEWSEAQFAQGVDALSHRAAGLFQ
ncbi:hypothetical protein BV25DRAFT_1736282 [Artomyces pyxidatus]|uniref:Uncharacterized protein n=1 Tax=Artomyces pyxidatus TaxID=48021 RepID=A0ACB8SHE7_9AGAM|nr:hypothetical protein BV25DRAFT_1736282 [Artomyces pyxidatus]